jgi:MtN3 and saliva related transmembrane protein
MGRCALHAEGRVILSSMEPFLLPLGVLPGRPFGVQLLGYVAASLTTVSFLPQALKTLRSRDTSGISLRMYGLFTSGIALWGIYGLLTQDGPLIVANGVTLIPAGIVLERKIQAVLRQWSQR